MRKTVLLSMIMGLMLSAQSLVAQAPTIQWQKTMGGSWNDAATCIRQTTDGGFIVAGITSGDIIGNHGVGDDCLITKFNSQGAIQWQKSFGGTDNDSAYAIIQTLDGGYIFAGNSGSNDWDVNGNHGIPGRQDYWIVKLNSQGDLLWQKTIGGTGNEYARSIQQTSDGGYVIAGYATSNDGDVTGNNGYTDYWIVKINSQGTIQWQKNLGGTGVDLATCIQTTIDGGYIVAGHTLSIDGDVTGNHGGLDYWIVKLNNLGEIQWQKTIGGTDNEETRSILQTTDGGYIVSGLTSSNDGDVIGNHGNSDYWIVKLNNQGTIQWQKTLGGTSADSASSIQQTADGAYIVIGGSISNDGDVSGNHGGYDSWGLKLNSQGTILWQKTFGGTLDDFAQSIIQTSDGGYAFAGITNSTNGDVTGNQGNNDMWIVKLSPDALQTSEFGSNVISISPNPASTYINIQLKNINDLNGGTINIINSLGQVIITTPIKITEMNNSIQLNTLGSKGIYFVQIINSKGQLIDVKKIILQ